jgi:glucosamine kinase
LRFQQYFKRKGMTAILIADSGATKTEWCLVAGKKRKTFFTQGISPYFFNSDQIAAIVQQELAGQLKKAEVTQVFYYGTGCATPENARIVARALKRNFPGAGIKVDTDIMGAARALCGNVKGVACILGTGMSTCFFNGRTITKNNPGLGYVLGDEGSGAYLGKKVVQYYLYNTFDEDLRSRFDAQFVTTRAEILDHVYKKPLPNRYLAGFTMFLAENRGHYMIENIIEDGLNDFFFHQLCKYAEVWKHPVHFVGGVAYGFRDVVLELCRSYEFEVGTILKNPMDGLVAYHQEID